jgi:hypothetical protein
MTTTEQWTDDARAEASSGCYVLSALAATIARCFHVLVLLFNANNPLTNSPECRPGCTLADLPSSLNLMSFIFANDIWMPF